METLIAPSLAAEMAAYLGTAVQVARYLRQPDPTDDELKLGLHQDGFTASEITEQFEAAKKAAVGE